MADQSVIKVLVTGFGPFPGMHDNPSGNLVRRIEQDRLRLPSDIILRTAVIPTSWDAVERFVVEDFATFDPDIALLFGVSSRARGFHLEQVARNTASTAADCEGKTFVRARLAKGAPSILHTSIDAEQIVQKLRKRGLKACISADAGRYLCNMLFYLSLKQSMEFGNARQTGFVHVPPLTRIPNHLATPFGTQDLLMGAQVIINHTISVQRRLNRMQRNAA